MADIIKEQAWAETLEQKQSYEDLIKQLSELEKQIWWDWIIWDWDSILDEHYEKDLKTVIEDWNLLSDKILMLKSILEIFNKNKERKKYDNANFKRIKEETIKKDKIENVLLDKFPWKKEEINSFMNARDDMKNVLHDNEWLINFDLNQSLLWIIERWTDINESTEIINNAINSYRADEIKKIVSQFKLTPDIINNIINSNKLIKWEFSIFSNETMKNWSFFFNNSTWKETSYLKELLDEIKKHVLLNNLNKNKISKKRNFSEIIKDETDSYTMWLEFKANLEKEVNPNSKETKDSYFKSLNEFLVNNHKTRSIFLSKTEVENAKNIDSAMWLKRWLWECEHTKELLWKLRVKEMESKADKMLDKAKDLYNEEWLKQLKLRIIEKVKADWKECVLDYIKFFTEFDKEAIQNKWINEEKHPKDKEWKIRNLENKEVWEMLEWILKAEVDELASKLIVILSKHNLQSYKFDWKDEDIIRKELLEKWLNNEEIDEIIILLNKSNKIKKQIVVMTKFNSLSSENQTKFLSDFENAKKEWKEPSEAIKILDTYVQKNSEEAKQNILKSYPEAIVNLSSNWWAEIKVWKTEIDLNFKEFQEIWNNPEKIKKLVEFKESLDDLWLWFLWKDRTVLFQNIKNKKGENSINMLDDDLIWEQEFKNILDYVAYKIDIPRKENLQELKNDFLKIKNERLFNKIDYSKFGNDKVFLEIFKNKWLFEKNTETLRREI